MTFADAYAAMAAIARQHGDTAKLGAGAWFLFEKAAQSGSAPEFTIYSTICRHVFGATSLAEVVDLYRSGIQRSRAEAQSVDTRPLDTIGDCALRRAVEEA